MMVMQTSSPFSSTHGAKDCATMLRASEALRLKITSQAFSSPAPMKRATRLRVASMASVASMESSYRPRSGLAFMV